jgi:hypothetical protein
MSRTRYGMIEGSQPPADCEVFGQEESRSPWFLIIGSFVVALVIMAVVS